MKVRVSCRLCLGHLETVFTLKPTPIANNFTQEPEPFAPKLPLELVRCGFCGHVQIGYSVPGEQLFSSYRYRTPEAEKGRLQKLARELAKEYPHAVNRDRVTVVEIGGNNGLFTEALNEAGLLAVNIDPSAKASGLPKWFTSKTALTLREVLGHVKMVVANNVFAHVDDLRNVFVGINRILDEDGVIVFEVQYLPDLVKGGMFDMIYHEHKDYHTLAPLPNFLMKFGWGISKVEHLPTHGGSIRVHCRRGPSIAVSDPAIDWGVFSSRVEAEKQRLNRILDKAEEQVVAFGATAKACTLIHHFGLQKKISYCVDSTKEKHGLYIPGTAIKIFPVETLHQSKSPKVILVTAWNYADQIIAKNQGFNFIVPFQKEEKLAA